MKKPANLTYQSSLLRAQRKDLEITSQSVAKALKVSAQFYGHIENGHVHIPNTMLKALCKVLKLDKRTLIDAIIADFARDKRQDIGLH